MDMGDSPETSARTIRYYAVAQTPRRTFGLLLVTRQNGRQVSQDWTGEEYPGTRAGWKRACDVIGERNIAALRGH